MRLLCLRTKLVRAWLRCALIQCVFGQIGQLDLPLNVVSCDGTVNRPSCQESALQILLAYEIEIYKVENVNDRCTRV